ncbi:PREDICTED: tumor protein p53-inducible protein 13 [Nanorana parkeri]|uniref:tumor protein p53-inducible protein 13 n=1 Tax=Nanorana parkeri TaxID=125878 RepID=UPI0008540641|nr:PREDICTED: tumor protein p53-inducible protein 13 [Nanorana parkeri]
MQSGFLIYRQEEELRGHVVGLHPMCSLSSALPLRLLGGNVSYENITPVDVTRCYWWAGRRIANTVRFGWPRIADWCRRGQAGNKGRNPDAASWPSLQDVVLRAAGMWRLCALGALLVAPVPVRSSVCDDGQSNIHLDLPDESVYLCPGDYIPPSSQVYPSIATKYKEEETYHACMDVLISHTAPIPNSGAHRPIGAKYGEYIYCPPHRWVHNLQHAGVAFLYHPCLDPRLKEDLSFVARSCVTSYIITPLPGLSRERPMALVTWCSTLEMSRINVTEIKYWLKENIRHEHPNETVQDGAYQHLLIRPSLISSNTAELCHGRVLQMLNHFLNYGGRSSGRLLRKRRRAVLLPTPVVQDMVSSHASGSISSSALAGQHKDKTTKKHSTVTLPTGIGSLSSPTESFSSTSPVRLTQESHTQGMKAETEENDKGNTRAATELPVQKIMPTLRNQSLVLPEGNDTQPMAMTHNVSQEAREEQPSQAWVTQQNHLADTPLKETSVNAAPRPDTTLQSQHHLPDPMLSPTATEKKQSGEQKQECNCRHDTAPETLSKAQRRLGGSQKKSSEGFVSTPRTEEATWAAASLIFLFSLLTFSVLYTQIYKRVRKSQSLYWSSENHSEEKETVASIIKRRLVQGHTRRKQWFGKKKSPTVLYESLSESSE